MQEIYINLDKIPDGRANMADLPVYVEKVLALAGEGNRVVLTGAAPVWLYLNIAQALQGRATSVTYRSLSPRGRR